MYKKILLTSILILIFSSCSNEEIPITSGNTLSPPGWPVIFQGLAKVNGKDITGQGKIKLNDGDVIGISSISGDGLQTLISQISQILSEKASDRERRESGCATKEKGAQ